MEILGLRPEEVLNDKNVICYCRCSTSKQAEDLQRQVKKVKDFCVERFGVKPVIFSETGSGLSDSRRLYLKLIEKIVEGSVSTVVCYSSDRLSRFGNNTFQFLCEKMGVKLVFIEKEMAEKTYEQEMMEDLMAIIHVYSCRLYGRRGQQTIKKDVSEEAKRRIIELRAQGYSVVGISRILEQEGFTYLGEDEPISRHVMSRLVNEFAKEQNLKKATGTDNTPTKTTLIKEFIEARCTVKQGMKVFTKPLYDNFCEWVKSTGKKGLSKREFGNQMKASGFTRGKSTKGQRVWFGLFLSNKPEASSLYKRTK